MRTRAAVTHAASAHIPASDYIPLGTPLTPHVIKLSGTGDYLAIWRLEGITFETADRAEILVRKEALHNFIRSLGGGAYALWSHKIRRVSENGSRAGPLMRSAKNCTSAMSSPSTITNKWPRNYTSRWSTVPLPPK